MYKRDCNEPQRVRDDFVDGAFFEELIVVVHVKGHGTEDNPIRRAKNYYDKNGNFLFQKDSLDE